MRVLLGMIFGALLITGTVFVADLCVSIPDLAACVRDPQHAARLTGTATFPGLATAQPLHDGQLLLYIAPKLLGPAGRPLVALPELGDIGAAPAFTLVDTLQLGEDLRLRLRPRAAPGG